MQDDTPKSELLLLRIATSLEFVANKTAGPPVIHEPHSQPGVSTHRPRGPVRTLPAVIQMQTESLDAYYVPQIFSALPVLLILAIVLFFIGLIEFLWSINHTVAYPSVITISLILAFILYTTLRPGLQGPPRIGTSYIPTNTPNSLPTIPCPYRYWEVSMNKVNDAFRDFLFLNRGSQGFRDQLLDYVHMTLEQPLLPFALPRDQLSQASHEIKLGHSKVLFSLSGVNTLNDLSNSISGEIVVSAFDLALFSCTQLGKPTSSPWSGPISLAWYNASRYNFMLLGEQLKTSGACFCG